MSTHSSDDLKLAAVKLYKKGGETVRSIAKKFMVSRSIVHLWIKRYDRTRNLSRIINIRSGRQPKINDSNVKNLFAIIEQPASNFGYETDFWTILRVRQVLKKELNLSVSRSSIHRTLTKIKYSYRKPESRYYHKNKEADSKKWINDSVVEIKKCLKKHKAILYFQDEANVSLSPTIAKTWGSIGVKLIRQISPNRGSVSVISAVSKTGYLLFNVHDKSKRFKSDDIINFLDNMLKNHKRRHLVVVMDRASCHVSKKVKKYVESQKRLHVFYLPPRCPEFNPDEFIWAHLKNVLLKEHKARTTAELKTLTTRKLRKLATEKKLVSNIFHRSEGACFFN